MAETEDKPSLERELYIAERTALPCWTSERGHEMSKCYPLFTASMSEKRSEKARRYGGWSCSDG